MKKILLSVFVLGSFLSSAQTNVSTTPENKNVVLEEFTGISCPYCPDGHAIAEGIKNNNPGDVMLINIHTGGYATPQGAGTDFRTNYGSALATNASVSGYPTGSINRVGPSMSRSDWSSSTAAQLSQPSPVNIWSEAIIDMGTNTLTVNVEIYYTGSQTATSNKLNVAVLQNNIEGPQSGGAQYNPSAILSNGNYNHTHMLRHLMTGQWGDDITNVTQGNFETRSYTWNMPSNINGVDFDPTNLEIVSFIAEGQQNILTGNYANTSIVFPNSYDAYYSESTCSDAVCGTDVSPEVTFKNYGNVVLTSLDIEYSINGGANNTYNWTGSLNSGATQTISLPSVSFSPQANNSVNVTLNNPNGNTDQNTSNNSGNTSFAHFASAGQVTSGISAGQVSVAITTDMYGSETTWKIISENGTILGSGGPYSNLSGPGTTSQPTEYANINQNECYSFIIEDSYGDGMNGQYGSGGYTVTDSDGNIIAQGGADLASMADFTFSEQENFETESTSVSVNELNNTIEIYPNPVKNKLHINGEFDIVKLYDVYGKLVYQGSDHTIDTENLSNGIYITNIDLNNNTITKRVTISK